jgi:hypothetical protein
MRKYNRNEMVCNNNNTFATIHNNAFYIKLLYSDSTQTTLDKRLTHIIIIIIIVIISICEKTLYHKVLLNDLLMGYSAHN